MPTPLRSIVLLVLLIVLVPAARIGSGAGAGAGALYTTNPQEASCDFEEKCAWTWNQSEPFGFRTIAGQEGETLLKNDGVPAPTADASNNTQGHFLFLKGLVNLTELYIKSPVFSSTLTSCTLRMSVHMANVTNHTFGVLVESIPVAGSAAQATTWWVGHLSGTTNGWEKRDILISQITQNFTIVLAVSRPERSRTPAQPSHRAHIAIDNIKLVNCFPVPKLIPPAGCTPDHFSCNNGSCLERWHVCDLVADCAQGEDERQDCDKVPAFTKCDFENGTCGWTAYRSDPSASDWMLGNCTSPSDFSYRGSAANAPANMLAKSTLDVNGTLNNLSSSKEQRAKSNGRGTCLAARLGTRYLGPHGSFESPIINPPPKYHGNFMSQYYNTCDVRFSYKQFGQTPPTLRVILTEIEHKKNTSHQLFSTNKDQGDVWYQTHIHLPNITRCYTITFEVLTGRGSRGYLWIDDISMSPECFGLRVPKNETDGYDYDKASCILDEDEPLETVEDFVNKTVYEFGSCGATGPEGPFQSDCVAAYNNTGVSVTVLGGRHPGVQSWTVPETDMYTLVARGASGGKSSSGKGVSLASQVRIVVFLNKGTVLLFLVGQEGLSAMHPDSNTTAGRLNGSSGNTTNGFNALKRNQNNLTLFSGGGGGGGGGTFVMQSGKSRSFAPILVAAGGGGLGSNRNSAYGKSDNIVHGHGYNFSRDPRGGIGFGPNPAGPGGGWRANNASNWYGLSLLQGGQGGSACPNVSRAHGGFGGGGGGCKTGGGGGGYSGGNTWSENGAHGEGGYSFVGTGLFPQIKPAYHQGPGSVIVIPAVSGCNCQYRCVALNARRSRVACVCPPEWTLSPLDAKSCIAAENGPSSIVLTIALVVFLIVVAGVCYAAFVLYNRYQRKKERSIRGIRGKSGPDFQLERLRHASDSMMTEFNPNYEFAGTTYTINDMRKIPREQLSLVKALGQGAFGEVYQGFFRHRAGDAVEMPVAVKTLPELSTSQAENDFLTEALIMSKFNHPNIVHLIGVCFDKHPRFIVLELLAGGDLKTFLRESRPRQDILQKTVSLSMHDLLTCAMDVAKGCKYLEDNRFIHRDIAARNCLLTSKGPGRVVKIADFGMAREVYMSDYYRKGGKAMLPVKWMPPEAFLDGIFTCKTDVWSFGVLLWEVMSLGYMPYTGLSNREVMTLVVSGGRLEQPPNCPPPVYAIMCQCWNPRQNERPSFGVLLERLGYCMQDPEVLSTPMPVFSRPSSVECDSTVMRPSDDACPLSGALGEDYLVPIHNHAGARRGVPNNLPWLLPGLTTDGAAAAAAAAAAAMPAIAEEDHAAQPWRQASNSSNTPSYTPTTEKPPTVPMELAPPAPVPECSTSNSHARNGPVPLDVSALKNQTIGYVNVRVKDQGEASGSAESGVQPAGTVLPDRVTC